ncbi:helix-turn-helix domain-containing protein [Halobacterium zhouii]|uniref:helix-turn-helix domain-containing protein n=1 Tax=Halobacterium zhouii TaxID=2902624 RepID=UPI001E3BC5EA|nr:helix-turn-helix domain-containing protein [Halobacterium zhouii]
MTTKTPAELSHSSQTDDLAATDIFPLLADDRRRAILHYLCQHTGAVSLGELAEQLAVREDNPTYDHYERILTDLHHTQLPKLVDGGLVRYDVDQETVRALDAIESVRPYLDLAFTDDCQ